MSFRHYEPEQVGGMLVYEGSRRQRGGNFIGTLKKAVLPLGKIIASRARKIGKDVAKRGVRAGVGAIADKIRGGPNVTMKEAFKRRAAAAADRAVVDYLGEDDDKPDVPFVSQDGYGLKRKRRKKITGRITKRKRKSINKRRRISKPKKKRKTTHRRSDIFS